MYKYETEIAKREMINPLFSYSYKVTPLSDQAKLQFSLHQKQRGPMYNDVYKLIKDHLNMDKFPFSGKLTFYYEDLKENEEMQKDMTKDHAVWCMAEWNVRGISHPRSGKNTMYAALIKSKDYEIEVGEKIIHEQQKTLTFNDIKAL